ncbi:MAG: hypothetical protein ABEI86_14560 [Halobacteriaceae archaeon]
MIHALNAKKEDTFQNAGKAMMMGSTLGDIDLIHRRVDENKFKGADFAKRAKTESAISFFEGQETSPINEIIRWNGIDIKDDEDHLLDYERIDPPKPKELEVIRQFFKNPAESDENIAQAIRESAAEVDSDVVMEEKEAKRIGMK